MTARTVLRGWRERKRLGENQRKMGTKMAPSLGATDIKRPFLIAMILGLGASPAVESAI